VPHDQARRLILAADLTRRAMRCADGAAPADAPGLLALASRLAAVAAPAGRAHRMRFEPAFPGVSAGVEEVAGGRRLVLACRALGPGGDAVAVVWTTLAAGRPPAVAVAPPEAPIPPGWTAPPPAPSA
jgi:hypothetical protein